MRLLCTNNRLQKELNNSGIIGHFKLILYYKINILDTYFKIADILKIKVAVSYLKP